MYHSFSLQSNTFYDLTYKITQRDDRSITNGFTIWIGEDFDWDTKVDKATSSTDDSDVFMSFDFRKGMTNIGSDSTVASLVGGATRSTSGVTFDGVNGYVNFTNYTNFYGAITVNVVFKLHDLDNWQRIFDFDSETNKTSNSGNGGSFFMAVASNNVRIYYDTNYLIEFPVLVDFYYNVTVVFDDVNDK